MHAPVAMQANNMTFFLLKRSLIVPDKGMKAIATQDIKLEIVPVSAKSTPLETRKLGRMGLIMYETIAIRTLTNKTAMKAGVNIFLLPSAIAKIHRHPHT